MTPYFGLLTDSNAGIGNAVAAADVFAASQLLQRPGLAQTQAALARELSEGTDEAAQLFRTATNLGRGIEQSRVSLLELESLPDADTRLADQIAERRARLLDGQHDYLKATALRQLGRSGEAPALLAAAERSFAEVRDGLVISVVWLRAQVLGELAENAERAGEGAEAERLHKQAVGLLQGCLLYTSPSPRDATLSRMPSSA